MTSSNAFPSAGISGAFDPATWKTVQQFIQTAQHLPTSPNPAVEAILTKFQTTGAAVNAGPVLDVSAAANGVYNLGETMKSTLGAIAQVMANGETRPLSQLVESLAATVKGPLGDVTKTSTGLTSAVNAMSGAATSLRAEAVKVSSLVGAANDNVASGAASLKTLLTATPLEADKLDTAMDDIRTAAAKMAGQSFVGLSFDPTDGVAALQSAQSQMAACGKAFVTLRGAIQDLINEIAKTPADKLASLPQLQNVALTTAVNEWSAVANDAHNFMLNFYVVAE